ncbi:MAG TPA: hypothetical protein VFM18_23600 [Methanosarcina sp.]|nr:hypothetical protein [Methanosarcina sp.]
MTYRPCQHCLVEFYKAYKIAMRRIIWKRIKGAFRNNVYSGVRVIHGKAY